MPNWCENDLYIRGPKEEVDEVVKFIGDEFNFGLLIPYPEKFAKMDAERSAIYELPETEREAAFEAYEKKWGTSHDGYNAGGYEWCIANWGTKWNRPEVSGYEHPQRGMCLSFSTAWAPPTPIIAALSEKFPSVSIEHEYFECGCCFCGGNFYPSQRQLEEGYTPTEWYSDDYRGSRGG